MERDNISENYQQVSNRVKRQVTAKKCMGKGVYKRGDKYRAQYTLNGTTVYVGTWKNRETAVLERDKALNEALAKLYTVNDSNE